MGENDKKVFEEVKTFVKFPQLEEDTLRFWKEKDIFSKLRSQNSGKEPFVFLEGPPTANGVPHVGHAAGRALKDVFLRYKAMSGFDVLPWKGGWDCHGLPVEIEVEKQLGLKSKKDIVEYGLEEFNRKCRKSVMRYEEVWKKMTERLGFWIDMENPYITMENYYIESVWWSLKELWSRKLLFKGHYVVPYCPRCGTPLSSHEVAQGYKTVKDSSVFIKFKVKGKPDTYFLVWTTTPWTLFSNQLLAVGRDITYAIVDHEGQKLILAKDLVEKTLPAGQIVGEMPGEDLLAMEYEQLLPYLKPEGKAFYVTDADFVSTEEGTGIVHIAPAFGVEDQELCNREGVVTINPVDEKGCFTEDVKPFAGVFVKAADAGITKMLDEMGLLFGTGEVEHTYPFCWRCDSPLLYYALDSWFVKMSSLRVEMLKNNDKITWKPEHLKVGRFGKFLEEAKDWALSRNRFWGTPLPVWNCACGEQVCIGGMKELESLAGPLPDNFELHRPWVDDVKVKCPKCQGQMVREPYVIDTWYDSGSAPFAQFHYPFENKELFKRAFQAHFITEALDQTRGWFYTLLAVNTSVFGDTPYLSCLTQGLMLNDEGLKMSKSKGTAIDPFKIFNENGADALRLAMFSVPAWTSTKFSYTTVKEAQSKVLTTLWNVYGFFVSNANLDGFAPSSTVKSGNSLDRWMLSRLNTTAGEIMKGFDEMEVHKSTRAIFEFVDDLSNWYLRRSRRRFWEEEDPKDKLAAYSTLYKVLSETTLMLAPFTPFIAENMYGNLVIGHSADARESVHLASYPVCDPNLTDQKLEDEMALVRKIAEAGRNARQSSGVKLRQPLESAVLVCEKTGLAAESLEILKDELNVKDMQFSVSAPALEEGFSKCDGAGFAVYMDMRISPALLREGIVRDVVRRVQSLRKELNLKYDQSIELGFEGDQEVVLAIDEWKDYISNETLAATIKRGELAGAKKGEWKLQELRLEVWVLPL
jgi:isoleucyl-tRNA synthetase